MAAECEWCEGTMLVTLWHRDYDGGQWVTKEVVDRKTGEVIQRRIPGRVVIRCVECELGRWAWTRLDEKDRAKMWNTELYRQNTCNYLTTDPTYRTIFGDWSEAVEWMKSLGRPGAITRTFPALPRPARRQTPADVADALRRRAEREAKKEPAA